MGGTSSTLKERAELASKSQSLVVGELKIDCDDFASVLEQCPLTLRAIDASTNSIKTLPVRLAQYGNLKQLSFANNKLSQLPPQVFGALAKLEKLNLDCNSLAALPDLSGLVKLKELHAANNKISQFPTVLPVTLLECDLSHNSLSQLPDTTVWGGATRLTVLDVSDNKLKMLPSSLGAAPALRTLKADNNQLSEIPEEILRDTPIDVLALKGNKFSERDFREFPGVEEYVARRKARCDKALNATVEFGRDLF